MLVYRILFILQNSIYSIEFYLFCRIETYKLTIKLSMQNILLPQQKVGKKTKHTLFPVKEGSHTTMEPSAISLFMWRNGMEFSSAF